MSIGGEEAESLKVPKRLHQALERSVKYLKRAILCAHKVGDWQPSGFKMVSNTLSRHNLDVDRHLSEVCVWMPKWLSVRLTDLRLSKNIEATMDCPPVKPSPVKWIFIYHLNCPKQPHLTCSHLAWITRSILKPDMLPCAYWDPQNRVKND